MIKIKHVLQRYPSIGKGIVSGVLFSLSDVISQTIIQKNEVDWKRNVQFLVLGLSWIAPCIQIWYSKLLPYITTRFLHNLPPKKKLLARLFIDTLAFSPVTYGGFYVIKDVILREDRSKIRQKLIPTLLIDATIWIPGNFINFIYIPVPYQGLFVGFFSFFFNIFLSWISHKQLQFEKIDRQQKQIAKITHQQVKHHTESLQQKIIKKVHPKKFHLIT